MKLGTKVAAKPKPARGRPRDPALATRRREEILDAASQVFARQGYACTDIQVIADAIGVGKATVYRYFPSKETLFLATVDCCLRALHESVDAASHSVADPLDRVVRAIVAYLQFFDAHPEFAELLLQEHAAFKDQRKPIYFERREANINRWRELFAGLIADGRIRNMPVEQITNVLGDLVYGTMLTNLLAGRRGVFERQAREIVDTLFHGILSEGERARNPCTLGHLENFP